VFKSTDQTWRYERKCEWVFFFIIVFGLGLGINLQKLASASASRFWPRLTSLGHIIPTIMLRRISKERCEQATCTETDHVRVINTTSRMTKCQWQTVQQLII